MTDVRLETAMTNSSHSYCGCFLSRRCRICSDESPVGVSGDGQGVGAGLAFALQPSDPAVYEQRAEEPVHATAAARLLQALHGRKRKDYEGAEQSLCRDRDDVCLSFCFCFCFLGGGVPHKIKSCNICVNLMYFE